MWHWRQKYYSNVQKNFYNLSVWGDPIFLKEKTTSTAFIINKVSELMCPQVPRNCRRELLNVQLEGNICLNSKNLSKNQQKRIILGERKPPPAVSLRIRAVCCLLETEAVRQLRADFKDISVQNWLCTVSTSLKGRSPDPMPPKYQAVGVGPCQDAIFNTAFQVIPVQKLHCPSALLQGQMTAVGSDSCVRMLQSPDQVPLQEQTYNCGMHTAMSRCATALRFKLEFVRSYFWDHHKMKRF